MMEITQNQQKTWNGLVIKNKGSFLQSWEWGEFQKSLGRKIWRFPDPMLCIKYPLPFGKNYLYCPRLSLNAAGDLKEKLETLKRIAKEEKPLFIKLDWELTEEEFKKDGIEIIGFKKSFKQVQPKSTIIINLAKDEAGLLQNMKPKTRYNIKVAKRKNLEFIGPSSGDGAEQYFEDFYILLRETAQRNSFHLHSKNYYHTQLNTIPFIRLFLVKYQNNIIAGAMIVFFGQRATYLHGASSGQYKNLMAPYFLHWEIMKYAKVNGYIEYDLWGISSSVENSNKEDAWAGVTRFKKGFGGAELHYAGAYDFICNKPWYGIYKMVKSASRK